MRAGRLVVAAFAVAAACSWGAGRGATSPEAAVRAFLRTVPGAADARVSILEPVKPHAGRVVLLTFGDGRAGEVFVFERHGRWYVGIPEPAEPCRPGEGCIVDA